MMAQSSILSDRPSLAGDRGSSGRVIQILAVCMRREIRFGSMLDGSLKIDVTPRS